MSLHKSKNNFDRPPLVTVAMTDKQWKIQARINTVLCVVIDPCISSVQTREPIIFSFLLKARNEHE